MDNIYTVLAGTGNPSNEAWEPFAPRVLDFLDAFSGMIRKNEQIKGDAEVMALAFWCRRAHLLSLKRRYEDGSLRLGRGLIFHLAPANVPMMFFYTYAIGLLAGNAGIIRISERTLKLESVQAVLQVLRVLFGQEESARQGPEETGTQSVQLAPAERQGQPKQSEYQKTTAEFADILERSSFISYDRSDAVTEKILQHCDGRVLWGGDETIRQMRRIPMPAHAVELTFPDRVSLAVINEVALEKLEEEELRNLVHRFYNDTYVMDQNGCSSPQTVIWLKGGFPDDRFPDDGFPDDEFPDRNSSRYQDRRSRDDCNLQLRDGFPDGNSGCTAFSNPVIREKWWELLAEEAGESYPMDGFRAARKMEKAVLASMQPVDDSYDNESLSPIKSIRLYHGNVLYVLRLSRFPENLAALKGGFGLFYETEAVSPEEIFKSFSSRIQTVVCIGIQPRKLAEQAAEQHAPGALRFVEPGQALQMDTVWDGTDLIAALSRRIV